MQHLSNEALVQQLKRQLAGERGALVEFLRMLGEVERRKLHLDLGYQNLGEYCQKELGLREGESWNRVRVAFVARRLPVVLELLADGRHCLTTVRALAPYLEGDDAVAVLERAAGKSTRGVERLVAEIICERERAKRPAVATVLPKGPEKSEAATPTRPAMVALIPSSPATPAAEAPVPPRKRRETVRHVTPTTFTITFEADEATRAELDRILEVRRAQGKEATIAAAMKDMMQLYLDKTDKARGLARKAQKAQRAPERKAAPKREKKAASRYIPACEELKVFTRDGYRCAYVGPSGTRCAATAGLQRDHVRPYALGGTGSARNLRYLCAAHNRRSAERTFGKATIERACRAAKQSPIRTDLRRAAKDSPIRT